MLRAPALILLARSPAGAARPASLRMLRRIVSTCDGSPPYVAVTDTSECGSVAWNSPSWAYWSMLP